MKAVAVTPSKADSIRLVDAPDPRLDEIPDGRGVLVDLLRVGGCGTDLEIVEGQYGAAPPGFDYLILGHENLGRVAETGPNVPDDLRPGTLVVATVRRPGASIYDRIGLQDFTTDADYHERGINLLHGFMAEQYVEAPDFLVPLPDSLAEIGVLLEPTSVCEKGITQAYEIQRRLKVWEPRRAAVLGVGPIGLLSLLLLRLHGIEVVCYSRGRGPTFRTGLVEEIGGVYVSSQDTSMAEAAKQHGPFDIIIEATGHSPLIWEAAQALGNNGVLVLESVTGGDREATIPSDAINQGFVLGNKVMVGTVNASRADFERGVTDLIQAESRYPGWLAKLLTSTADGLERFEDLLTALRENKEGVKETLKIR